MMMMMMRMMTALSSSNPFFFVFNGRTILWWIMEYLLRMAPCLNDHGRLLLPHPFPSDGGDTFGCIRTSFLIPITTIGSTQLDDI
jgi:hypothetical protein